MHRARFSTIVRFACLTVAAPLFACAPRPATQPSAPPSRTSSIDGTYAGLANGSCGSGEEAFLRLRDGRFTLSVPASLHLEGRAEPDGTLTAVHTGDDGREINFNGHIADGVMRGGSYNGHCAFAFAMTRETRPAMRTAGAG